MYQKRGVQKKYRGFFAKHKLWIAITTQIGTVVGAGVLGIPYVLAKSGFLYGSLMILLIGLAFLVLNLFTGEIILRTKEQHQLTGYMEKYLGRWGKQGMTLAMGVGIYGALTAYLIGEGQVLKSLFGNKLIIWLFSWLPSSLFNFMDTYFYSLLFFLIVTLIIYKGVKATGKAELIIISLLFVVVFFIGLLSFRQINPAHFTLFNPLYFFLPYGVVLFSFMGSAVIPEMQEELEDEKHKFKKALFWGSTIPIVIYIIFSFIVVGLVGFNNFELLEPNQRIATIALGIYSNPHLGYLANLFAALTMFTTFLTLGIALTEMYNYDYHLSRRTSLLLTLLLPLTLTLSNLTTFITTLGITGALAGGLDGILIVLAYWKAKTLGNRKPEFSLHLPKAIGYFILVLFVLGIAYQIWKNFF